MAAVAVVVVVVVVVAVVVAVVAVVARHWRFAAPRVTRSLCARQTRRR